MLSSVCTNSSPIACASMLSGSIAGLNDIRGSWIACWLGVKYRLLTSTDGCPWKEDGYHASMFPIPACCWKMSSIACIDATESLNLGNERPDRVNDSSVIVQISFQRFLNLGNPWKPVKTRELGNMDTHVPFLGNLTKSHMVGTVETYRNLRNLTGKKILCTSGREKWLLSKSVCYPEEIS